MHSQQGESVAGRVVISELIAKCESSLQLEGGEGWKSGCITEETCKDVPSQ